MTSRCPHLVGTGNPQQDLHGTRPYSCRCALYSQERIGGAFLTAVCSTAGHRSCLRLVKTRARQASPVGPRSSTARSSPRAPLADVSPLPEAAPLPVKVPPIQTPPGPALQGPASSVPDRQGNLENNPGADTERSLALDKHGLLENSPGASTERSQAPDHQDNLENRPGVSSECSLARDCRGDPENKPNANRERSLERPVTRRSSRSFTFTEVVVLNLGVAAMFALLLVAVGIAFRVAKEPAVLAQPLSVTTNKMSSLVEDRFATPTSRPPALAAASALRISLKAHKAAQATAAVAYAEMAETQGPSAESSATGALATATLVAATQTPVPATAEPTLPSTTESLPQPTPTPVPLQPTPTPVPPPATHTPIPSRDAAAASQQAGVPSAGASPPTRITIPSIGLDVPVRPVGMISYEVAGETRYIWDTLPDTAAFHETSAYPGLPGNTVINGHRDIGAAVFRTLGEVQVGDAIQVFVNEAVGYVYHVEEILVVPHTHASQEQHAANRKLLGYFPEVRLTLVTCEPLGSATHRLVIIARPPAAQLQGTTP